MSQIAARLDRPSDGVECWCCGAVQDPGSVLHLCHRSEAVVCIGCAHWLSKSAWEIEDRSRTGFGVRVRGHVRRLRQVVIEHGWQDRPIIGPLLRWVGRHSP